MVIGSRIDSSHLPSCPLTTNSHRLRVLCSPDTNSFFSVLLLSCLISAILTTSFSSLLVQAKRNARNAKPPLNLLRRDAKPSEPRHFSLYTCQILCGVVFSVSSGSDDGPESEEEELTTPYPLEGKYVDEADRERYLLSFIEWPT